MVRSGVSEIAKGAVRLILVALGRPRFLKFCSTLTSGNDLLIEDRFYFEAY